MFNNAGIVGVVGPIAETPLEAWDHTSPCCCAAVFLGMKHAARVMVPQGAGVIISTSSTAGILGGLGPHCYTACKTPSIGLTKSVAAELGRASVPRERDLARQHVTAMTSAVISVTPPRRSGPSAVSRPARRSASPACLATTSPTPPCTWRVTRRGT